MPRKDPRIVVLEDDLTTAGVSAASTDVVFVPGFAETNRNYIIYKKSGQEPDSFTPGEVAEEDANLTNISAWRFEDTKDPKGPQVYPQYACNTVDQITWKCIRVTEGADDPEGNYEWEAQEVYVEPCPENVPVLCTTLSAFESYFGKKPYKFSEDQDVSDLFSTKYGATSAKGSKYMYKKGDYEKSYIYAKELVRAGMPVVYENIVDRTGKDNLDIITQVYSRNDRTVTIEGFDETTYNNTIGGGSVVTEAKVAVATAVDDQIQWVVDGVNVTEIFTINGTVVNQDKIEISAHTDAGYTTTYVYLSTPTITIDRTKLTAYMATKAAETGSLSYTEAIVLQYNTDKWQKNVGDLWVNANLETYGITLSDTNLVIDTDRINLVASYVETLYKREPTVLFLYKSLGDCYKDEDKLRDKGEFSVKYITSGAYPVYELKTKEEGEETGTDYVGDVAGAMITCAHDRGDAFALIDHTNNPERSLKATDGSGSVYAHVKQTEDFGLPASDEYNTFAAMFTPWATYTCTTAPNGEEVQLMPASFDYLMGMAQSIVTHPNWLAIAGVNRGIAPSIRALNTVERLTNTIADSYQPRDERAINAITNIKPYGLTIWGNRTLVSNGDGNLTGKSFLNIRSLICDIKKVAYTAAKSLLFEQNTEILWNKFKTQLTPTLDKMVHGYGLSSYKIIKATTKYNGTPLAKGEIAAVIRIVPIYAVEDFEITVVMTDEGVEVN